MSALLPWAVYVSRWLVALLFALLMLGTFALVVQGRVRFRWVLLSLAFQALMLFAVPEATP